MGDQSVAAGQCINSFILQAAYSRPVRPEIVIPQEDIWAHCTSVASDSGSKNLILIPNGSQGAVA